MNDSPKNGSRIIKNSVLSLFNTVFTIGAGWIISIWVARQLGPENYGIFTLVLWFSSAFSWIVGMGLTHAVTKYIAEYSGRNQPRTLAPIIRFVLVIEVSLSAFVSILLIFFRTQIADFFFSPSESFYFFLAFIGILPGVVTAIFSASIEGFQKFEYFTYANIIITPFSFASKITVLLLGLGIEGLLTVMLVFSFVNCIFYWFALRKEGVRLRDGARIPRELVSRIKKYNFSVLAIILCDKVIWDKSENFFLGRFCTAAQIGFYNLGFNIAQRFTSILPTTFWRVLFPAMSGYFGAGDQTKMKRLFFLSTRYLAFAAFPTGVAGIVLAYQIIHYLYGHEFIGAQRTLQVMFGASIITSLCNPGAAILYGYERQSFIYKLGFIMAMFNIALDIFLIRQYGALGAAIAYGCTTVIGATIGTIYTCRTMELTYPFASLTKIAFAAIMMGIVMELVLLQNPALSGFIIAVFAGAAVYVISALALGTFEEEDYILLESVQKILPGITKKPLGQAISFIRQFKRNAAVN